MQRCVMALGVTCLALVLGCSGAPPPVALPTATVSITSAPPTATPPPTTTAYPTPTPTRSAPWPTPVPATTDPAHPPAPAVALWKGATVRPLVALTFDAGSDVGHTGEILELLMAKGIRATFGLTGAWVRANPALARRIVVEGHQVVNHTDRHVSFTGRSTGTAPLTRAQRTQALEAAEASITDITGTPAAPWFRPPYGDRDASVDQDAGLAGYRFELMWTVDTLGWKGIAPAEVTRRVVSAAQPGEIVLMHVGAASTDVQALPDLIDQLRNRGYAFVRADRFS